MAVKLVQKSGNLDLSSPELVVSAVHSVNGKTGHIVLSAEDVGALPEGTEIPSIAGLATEEYVDKAIGGIEFPDTDLSNYYTKAEVDNAVSNASLNDAECIAALIQTDMLPTFHNGEGKMVMDENNNVVFRY